MKPVEYLESKVFQSLKKEFSKKVLNSISFQSFTFLISKDLEVLSNFFSSFEKQQYINTFSEITSISSFYQQNKLPFSNESMSYIEKVFNSLDKNNLNKIWNLSFFDRTRSYYSKSTGTKSLNYLNETFEFLKRENLRDIAIKRNGQLFIKENENYSLYSLQLNDEFTSFLFDFVENNPDKVISENSELFRIVYTDNTIHLRKIFPHFPA